MTFNDQSEEEKKKFMDKPFQLCVLSEGFTVYFLCIDFLIEKMASIEIVPPDDIRRNLMREEKKISLKIEKYQPEHVMNFEMMPLVSYSTNVLKNEVKLFGKLKDMFYTYTTDGFLSFFTNDCLVCGKLTFPSGEIVQWDIFYSLIQKILVRLSRVEEISK